MDCSVSGHILTAQLTPNGYTRQYPRGSAKIAFRGARWIHDALDLQPQQPNLWTIIRPFLLTAILSIASATQDRRSLKFEPDTTPHLRRGPVGNRRLGNTSIDRTINGTIFHSERTLRGTTLDSGSITSSSATLNSSITATNRHREAVDVLAHSIAPAISNGSPLAKVRTSLGVAVEEPQHPVDSGSGIESPVRLAISAAVSNAVQVALPSREVGRKSSVIALALESSKKSSA
jgi:hypothetical protein